MPNKVVTNLGRRSFYADSSIKAVGNYDTPSRSSSGFTTRVVPYGVTYSPYSLPGWRYLLKTNQNATTVLIGDKSDVEGYYRSALYRAGQFRKYSDGSTVSSIASGELLATYGILPTSSSPHSSKAQALAAEKFLSNYYDKTRSIRGASAIAEAGATLRGLRHPAKALRSEIDNLAASLRKRLYRSNGQQVKDGGKVVAGTWLEWQFGIKPLVSDVNGAAEAVNKMRDGNFNTVVTIRATGADDAVVDRQSNQGVASFEGNGSGPSTAWAMGTVDEIRLDRITCTLRGAIVCQPENGYEVPPIQQFGVGFEDILPAFWEAIPWSFFIDYFVNVSSVIDSWSFFDSSLAWMNMTKRSSRIHRYTDLVKYPDNIGGPDTKTSYVSGGHVEASYTNTLRSTVNWSDVAPSLRIKCPSGGTKWANIAALSQYLTAPKHDIVWRR